MTVIVTDSSAYLTREQAERLGAVVVPMTYSCAASPVLAESYVDENGAFDRLIKNGGTQMHTSQASMAAFVNTFQEIVDEGQDILCVTMSSRMSGTYSNAVFAAREVAPGRIRVVDSLNTSAGLMQLIIRGRALLDAGRSLEAAACALEELRSRVSMTFTVEDIEPLRRSGRIGSIKSSVSTILNIRPILSCKDGALVSSGIARGKNDQRRQLLRAVPANVKKVYVIDYDAREHSSVLANALRLRGVQAETCKLGPVLAIHLGAGSVGLSWINEEDK